MRIVANYFFYVFSIVVLSFASCQQGEGYEQEFNEESVGTMQVKVRSGDDAPALDITLFVYVADTLYAMGKPNEDALITVEMPLNEVGEVIAVADAESVVTRRSHLTTFTLNLNEELDNEVYASDILPFKLMESSGDVVPITLNRMVGKVSFVPIETQDEIDAITEFDMLGITFKYVVCEYFPKSGDGSLTDYTVYVGKEDGFSASVCSFFSGDKSPISLALEYYNLLGMPITKTAEDIPNGGIVVEFSKESRVRMSLFDDHYLTNPIGAPVRSVATEGPWVEYINF